MKAALINYIRQLAKELGPDGIRANAVSPGPIYIEGGSWDRIRQKKPDYCEANKARPLGAVRSGRGGGQRGRVLRKPHVLVGQRAESGRRRILLPAHRVLTIHTEETRLCPEEIQS